MIVSVKVWGARVLIVTGMVMLCWLVDSPIPAFGFALAWGPNGLFLAAFMRGSLRFPKFLERVYRWEPVLYERIGIRLVKRLVTNPLWPIVIGAETMPKPRHRELFLDRIEIEAKGAEICHGATFVLAFTVTLVCLAVDQTPAAVWITVFNIALNGYPVMLQRYNRVRVNKHRSTS